MSKVEVWLTKHGLKNRLTLILLITFILFIILLFMFLNQSDEDTGQITITENAELRTGPNAAYPVIYKIEKGDSFKKVDKKGKWIEVQNRAGTEKGWVAGWHTNLNIQADQSKSSNPLKGKTIVLDPGHGGSDQGASSNTPKKSLEKNYTLKTAKELKKILTKESAKIKMTRTKDEYVSLNDRNIKGDAYISIHNDSLDSSNANGATVYWLQDNQEALAQTLNSNIQKKALLTNRGARQQNYQVLRQTNVPAVLLELGYISNPTDESMITDQIHRQVVEQAIVDGLKQYFSS
ncbi:N-acetylmuramoyl-L-alanine amidase [Staphylococcus saccharolyticus]|mgnify:CR=1 FL=1|uniref:N-acetylmuramoyl-L-alanine amidase n=1 Tax=Staphylococcus saccharolyticus TaxID=33028 RepID=UPI00102DF081|nr:N-acetylmuramoyl-L-alanine amidase [Staphylococcus saccharolyticus]MBL7573362.1 N-acetylmuramoyl-L-alanine amidase [Staphylococcus saccharolyticus]MBL7583703.1 N-acetylmuramoyl-L-alanine amidase [Staphylococcus saccharolyticus]MBL7638980.1 N-acetylmuramoyl-L-alanine amidase [Staphylococcus saccharolyticus]QRJ69167.1 N-acetylmuramoyl-L-alanine amidase [Staphylococcus saccharolyticus]TAA93889.1 cell wall amidase [Staphylococcus saccharolyticus]